MGRRHAVAKDGEYRRSAESDSSETIDLRCELLDVLDAAVIVVDTSGRVVFSTERACNIVRVAKESLIGAEVADVLASLDELLTQQNTGAPPEEGRQKLRLPRDPDVIIGYRVAPVGSPASPTHHAIVFQDITAWERLREERDRLMRLAAVSEVLPSILHELKNPLAAIATAVELLVEESNEDSVRIELHAVLSEIRRMGLTLDGIGSVGRELKSQRFAAVDHAMMQTASVLARQATERGVRIECDVQPMPLLPFDVAMIRAMLFNMLTNAIHACSPGAEILIRASLSEDGKQLSWSVRDSGQGMSPEVSQRCRDLFFTTKARGTGIGLALCDRAARAAGGSMSIDSAPGLGTTIEIVVPVERPQRHDFNRRNINRGVRA